MSRWGGLTQGVWQRGDPDCKGLQTTIAWGVIRSMPFAGRAHFIVIYYSYNLIICLWRRCLLTHLWYSLVQKTWFLVEYSIKVKILTIPWGWVERESARVSINIYIYEYCIGRRRWTRHVSECAVVSLWVFDWMTYNTRPLLKKQLSNYYYRH